MKFFICALALVAAASAAPQYQPQPITKDGLAQIRTLTQDQNEDGSYAYAFDTDNGIAAREQNVPRPQGPNGEPAPDVVGEYQYTAPDGQVVITKYVANENGYVAEGSHIPPIPEAILRALAWNAAHPEEEAYWDPANTQPKGALIPGYYSGPQ